LIQVHFVSDLVSIALVIATTLVASAALVRSARRDGTLRLIVAGGSGDNTAALARLAALDEPEHRERLAAELERALRQAERWHELPVASRPPETVRTLAEFRAEIREIATSLRRPNAAAPGLALLELSLAGGYSSVLYAGSRQAVRESLWRIRFLLDQKAHQQDLAVRAALTKGSNIAACPRLSCRTPR
jgi:hypothetical protein